MLVKTNGRIFKVKTASIVRLSVSLAMVLAVTTAAAFAQPAKQKVRTMSIPISIFTKKEMKEGQAEEFLQVDRLIVKENGKEQTILSIRSITDAPLSLAVLIQDGLTSNVNLQLKDLSEFVRRLPNGSRVMVAYLRGGSMQVRQRFTTDLEKASQAFRIVTPGDAASGGNPYDGVIDTLDRFDALPAGRRAVLLVSDGLDTTNGVQGYASLQSLDLDRAILRAQRKNVAVFSYYSPTPLTESGSGPIVMSAQGSLAKLSDETGGRAFFQGTTAPISFNPFFRELSLLLNRQFLLSYLTDNMKKDYYKVSVTSTNPEVKIEHPRGYYFR